MFPVAAVSVTPGQMLSKPASPLAPQVYNRSMQVMQARLGGAPVQHGGPAHPPAQHPAQQAFAGQHYRMQPPCQQAEVHAAQEQERQQHQLSLLQAQHLQQKQQQLLFLQQQVEEQQRLLRQQAQAAAFPELPAAGWDEAAAGGAAMAGGADSHQALQAQQWQLQGFPPQQLPGLPPLPGGAVAGGSAAYGGAPAAMQLQPQQLQHGSRAAYTGAGAGWGGHAAAQPVQMAGVDEFGVSVAPSMSDDDEYDTAAAKAHMAAPAAAERAPLYQLHQQLLPSRGGPAAATAAAASGSRESMEGGQMGAFLGSRKRDFSVPRTAPPLASRPLAPSQDAE